MCPPSNLFMGQIKAQTAWVATNLRERKHWFLNREEASGNYLFPKNSQQFAVKEKDAVESHNRVHPKEVRRYENVMWKNHILILGNKPNNFFYVRKYFFFIHNSLGWASSSLAGAIKAIKATCRSAFNLYSLCHFYSINSVFYLLVIKMHTRTHSQDS